MKKHALKNAILLLACAAICLCASAKTTFSQQTESSTQTDDGRRVQILQALERAQAEVVAGRVYIDALKEQVKSKQAQIDALVERDAKRVEIENSLQSEITNLRAAIAEQQKALKTKDAEITDLKKELARLDKKLKSAHAQIKILGATTALLLVLMILK